ncbi:hypothetical protein XANCAGTX0491_005217 [Xanthoria calcicola]
MPNGKEINEDLKISSRGFPVSFVWDVERHCKWQSRSMFRSMRRALTPLYSDARGWTRPRRRPAAARRNPTPPLLYTGLTILIIIAQVFQEPRYWYYEDQSCYPRFVLPLRHSRSIKVNVRAWSY